MATELAQARIPVDLYAKYRELKKEDPSISHRKIWVKGFQFYLQQHVMGKVKQNGSD